MKHIVGYWNKSVILTYIGMGIAVLGMYFAIAQNRIHFSFACLILAGVCDLFDGAVARRVKRTEEEKEFGIQLDSLVDVLSFVAFPIVLFVAMGMDAFYHIAIYLFFATVGIARLGYFNVNTAQTDKVFTHYSGLPVTYTALILPFLYLLRYVIPDGMFEVICAVAFGVIGFLQLLKIKIAKPRGIAYVLFALLAVAMIVLYLVVL